MIKKIIKKAVLRKKKILIDIKTDLNLNIHSDCSGLPSRIIDSHIKIEKIGKGCFLEYVYGYGKIELGNYVSISGPGTILHSEIGKISVGSFSSIAENVSIQEFNHRMERPTTAAINHMVYHKNFKSDFSSKGDIIIQEDVWIGSNAVVLSGVTVGRGSVIAAGAVVTKDVPKYAIVAGNPAKIIKYRFSEEKIAYLESLKWWEWQEKKILDSIDFFNNFK